MTGESVIRVSSALLIGLLVALVLGCGGGTTGTGGTGSGPRTHIAGVIFDTQGGKISGAAVTVAETGDSGMTDQSGAFEFDTDLSATNVATLLVNVGSVQASTALDRIAENTSSIALELELDAQRSQLTVKEREDVVATPTPQPEDTPVAPMPTRPAATPTEASSPTPTAPPTGVPANPTPTSTATAGPFTPAPTPPGPTATPTGVQSFDYIFSGVLRSIPPSLIQHAAIRVEGSTFEAVQTDGRFHIATVTSGGNITVGVRVGSQHATAVLQGIPQASSHVRLRLLLIRHEELTRDVPDVSLELQVEEVQIMPLE